MQARKLDLRFRSGRVGNHLAACLAMIALFAQAASAETQSYVVEWFGLASHSQDGDCPGGVNPPTRVQYATSLALLGKSPQEVDTLMKQLVGEDRIARARVKEMLRNRGRMDGKPVNAFIYPWTVADPKLKSVVGKFALGFNLDGKISESSFEEPMTKELGIDNELFRALGCVEQFRGSYDHRSTFWAYIWGSMRQSMLAWLITVEGEDLEKDGPVTITFDRALEHVAFNATGEALADKTYRRDPDPRSHRVFRGQIKDRILTITEPGYLSLLVDTLAFPTFVLHDTQLRLKMELTGRLSGLIGGYQPWMDVYIQFAQGGLAYEDMIINDTPGDYYLLKRHADAYPDPITGENTAISAAYRVEAVPVFVVDVES